MTASSTTVLVTGASGLLGSALIRRLSLDGFRTIGLCNRHEAPGLISADLMDPDAVQDLARLKWDALINCAAFRSPDYCEQNPGPAAVLNARLPEWLAGLAASRRAPFIHISTDYVFSGEAAPYGEGAAVSPINIYGCTKVEAEAAVLKAHPGALVARIPALYGKPAPPAFSSLLQEGIDDARSVKPLALDDVTVRYPTPVEDVSAALSQALLKETSGILHISSGEKATRYAWTCRIRDWLGLDKARLTRGPQAVRPARRPVDCHLATDRLASLGLPEPRPFSEVMPKLLKELGLWL